MIEGFAPAGAPRLRRVAVLAFDGVVLADLATPCELFGRACDAAGRLRYQVRVCAARAEVATRYATLRVPWRLASAARADLVVVPGIDDLDRPPPPVILAAIRAAAARGARVASICTGAFLLAAAGVLDGHRATTHWLAAAELARRHPRVTVDPDVLYVDEGALLTSAGAAAAHDLCLHLVRRDLGAAVAAELARAVVMPLEREGGQAQFIAPPPTARQGGALQPLLGWAARHLGEDLSLGALARRAGMSTRSLSRHFRQQVGATPAEWVGQARVRRAQRLLETTALSVEEVAAEVGFGSPTVLRERFVALVGTSPQAYRRSFGRLAGPAHRRA